MKEKKKKKSGRGEVGARVRKEEGRGEEGRCWTNELDYWCQGAPTTGGNGWRQKREGLLLCAGGGVRDAGASWHPRAPASDDPRTGEEPRNEDASVGKERRGKMRLQPCRHTSWGRWWVEGVGVEGQPRCTVTTVKGEGAVERASDCERMWNAFEKATRQLQWLTVCA